MLENVSFESSQSLCTRFKICNQTIQKLKAFKCVNCIFATNSYIKFLLHLNPKMNSSNDKLKQKKNCKPFKCQNCMFITKSVSKFTFHSVNIPENSISVNDKSSCRICNKSFISKNALTEHMLCHTFKGDVVSKKKRQGIKKIELCNQMDETKIFYDIENNSTKIFSDMENNSLMTNKNNTSTTNQNNVSRLNKICNICNVVFVSSKTFNAHLLLHQPPKYICSVCNKKFILQTWYEKHLLCHKNEPTIKIKPNNCSTSIYKSHSLGNHKSFDEVTRTHAKDKTTTIGTQNNCSVSTNEINVSNNQNALADVENSKKVPKTKKTKVKEQKNLVKKKIVPMSILQ